MAENNSERDTAVEGNMLGNASDEENSSSSSSEEEDEEFQLEITDENHTRPHGFGDDDEEEIEVFGSGNSNHQSKSNPPQKETKGASQSNDSSAAINSSSAISKAVEPSPSKPTKADEFGISYQRKDLSTWTVDNTAIGQTIVTVDPDTIQASSDHTQTSIPPEDDEFAVFEGDKDGAVEKALESLKDAKAAVAEETISFEKERQEYSRNPQQQLAEMVISNNKLYTNSFSIFGGGQIDSQSQLSDEPLVIIDKNQIQTTNKLSSDKTSTLSTSQDNDDNKDNKSIIKESRKALNDIMEVYGQGMGDQEVLLLDMMENEGKDATFRAPNKNKKEAEVRKTQTVAIDKTLNVITEEEEEEEDEEEEAHAATSAAQQSDAPVSAKAPEKDRTLEDEFDAIVLENLQSSAAAKKGHDDSVLDDYDSQFKDRNDFEKVNYDKALEHFRSKDLSHFEKSIVVSEKNPHDSSWKLFGKETKLTFAPNANELLKFPFLLAQVDYDPFETFHLNILRSIYYTLIGHDMNKENVPFLAPIDDKWENIGFQGKDPRTDVNRSIKMLAILQV
jgi:hypothetical protein